MTRDRAGLGKLYGSCSSYGDVAILRPLVGNIGVFRLNEADAAKRESCCDCCLSGRVNEQVTTYQQLVTMSLTGYARCDRMRL